MIYACGILRLADSSLTLPGMLRRLETTRGEHQNRLAGLNECRY